MKCPGPKSGWGCRRKHRWSVATRRDATGSGAIVFSRPSSLSDLGLRPGRHAANPVSGFEDRKLVRNPQYRPVASAVSSMASQFAWARFDMVGQPKGVAVGERM